MILPDHRLRAASLFVGLQPEPKAYQPASVDLRLGREFKLLAVSGERDGVVNSWAPCVEYAAIHLDAHVIRPGGFVLAHTMETVRIPENMAAQVVGRSTLGRLGITVHVTAGWCDPGFCGQITLEIANLGTLPVRLRAGQRICQLVVHEMSGAALRSYRERGRYQGQTGAQEAK